MPLSAQHSTFAWSDRFLVGYAPMDEVHREFADLLERMRQAGDEALPALLQELKQHLHSHFALENALMQSSGFPASECHINEHAAVLQSIEDVSTRAMQGRLDDCRRLVVALADWFPGHSDYLDSALAQWVVSRKTGGKPIVIRRNQSL